MTKLLAFRVLACCCTLIAGRLGAQATLEVRPTARPCARVRQRPDPDAKSKTCLAPGTQVAGIGVAPFWRKIRMADARTGWIPKQAVAELSGPGLAATSTVTGTGAGAGAGAGDHWLEIHVVDVGQGDGIWIHTADDGIPGNGIYEGKNIIIDGGPDGSDGKNELLHYMQQHGTPEGAVIDAIIVSHPHDDHYPGAAAILRHYQVRDYYDPGYPSTGSRYGDFRDAVARETVDGHPIHQHIGRVQLGHPDWGSELAVQFLYAYSTSAELGSGNTAVNNASIVLRVVYGTQSFLFMGDAEGKERNGSPNTPRYVERWLLDSVGAAGLKSTVLKVAHHGSETSSTIPFIDAVDPQVVIVTSGRRKYGPRFLPDASTLRRYCTHNPAIRIYRTDQDDAAEHRTAATDQDGDNILIRTDGTVLQVDAYSGGSRITPTACEAN